MDQSRYPAPSDDADRYRLLVDAITDYAIYMLDPQGVVISWNPGAQRVKGYESAEILGQTFARFYTPEDRLAGAPQEALRIAATEGRYDREGWRVRKDGTHFWAHVVIDPVRDSRGAIVGFAKVTRDLTERRQSELALRQSQEQFRLLVQGVTDYAIYMLDLDGRVASWNTGAERIKGYAPEEIIGSHFSRFYSPEDLAKGLPQAGLEEASRTGRFESEGWRIRKDGTRFVAHVVIDAIRDDAGEVIGFAKITRDITERRRARKALEQAQQALFQSQKMESIGRLTGGVAHDFNNLLTAVLGSLELLRRWLPDHPKPLALLDNAVLGAQRGAVLTQRMLAFARRQPLQLQAIHLKTLVDGMMGLLLQSIDASVTIRTDVPAALPSVLTDPVQLESALLNLAVNGRDAMPDGGVLTIAGREEPASDADLQAGSYVVLSVADTGQGMDPQTLARATEPFFTTKGVGKGTGLGLSMVQGLAEQSGGRLVIRSTPGAGSILEIWLPAAEASAQVKAPLAGAAAEHPARRLTILAVDDDSLVLMNTVALLEDLGHTVIEALSGKAALRILAARDDIDLVLSDQAMPEMTGLQLLDAAAALRPALSGIIATGYAELPPEADPKIGRLAKPFRQAELAAAVAAACAAARPATD